MDQVIIHDLPSAADRAKVTPEVIRRWIAEGLRATPVGRVGKRGPRDYRIFDAWLIEFLEGRSERAMAPERTAAPAGHRQRRPSRVVLSAEDDDLWPLPPIRKR
jgi:hypothetical protein